MNPDSSGTKRALTLKAAELTTVEFIESRICPLLGPGFKGAASDCETRIVRNTGTGRLTIRYIFNPEVVVFGKLYHDGLGIRSNKVHQALWNNGFNNAARYRVPQPIAFLADYAFLLMLGVDGVPLGFAFNSDSSVDLVSGSHEAAEWLTTLHRSTLRVGNPDLVLESLRQYWREDRVIKAVTAHVDKTDMIRDLIAILEQRVMKLAADRCSIFTHGRYNHDHVFLSPNATSVIDLDRCRPSDPAKDIAEFVRVLRHTAFEEDFPMEHTELAVSAFLSSYLSKFPQAAANLGCYWATFTFHSLLRGLEQVPTSSKKNWKQLEEFYLQEIMRALALGQ